MKALVIREWDRREREAAHDLVRRMMDKLGNKAARGEIAMIKLAGPRLALRLIDDSIQAFGAAGLDSEAGTAALFARVRALRIADGPDEVHARTIARLELKKYAMA